MIEEIAHTDIDYDLLMKIQQGAMSYQYRGVPLQKNPFDLALYTMLLDKLKPRTLIEIGSYQGGSALWFADQACVLGLDLQIISIDLKAPDTAIPAVKFVQGDARDLASILPDSFMNTIPRPLIVIEDSSHMSKTTLAVLEFFDAWLRPGEYIVIEDGILSDMRVEDSYEGGPLRAIEMFLKTKAEKYTIDREFCDYFGKNVTWNVDGYLRRR